MTLASGTRLGPYEILSPLGAGGMGEVYKAKDTRLGRDVAVKVLPSHLSDSPELRARFEREARAVAALSHPHICAIFDVGSQDGIEYLVMELLDGQTLAERLEKGALPTDQTLKFGTEIASALDKAHHAGIVHRDLKPGNVMLTRSGVKLLDFGLAKVAVSPGASPAAGTSLPTEAVPSQPLTEQGTVMGTFQYMAPEQIEGAEADARTDIFAFGCVLYEMATGKKAFTGKSRMSLIGAILKDEPPAISTVAPATPPALDRVVKTCLAKDPEDRFHTAHDVKLQLEWIAEAGSQAGAPATIVSHRRSRERLAWGLLAGLVALFGVLLSVALRESHTNSALESRVTHVALLVPKGERLAFGARRPFAISPDGSKVALSVLRGVTTKLLLHSFEDGTTTEVPGSEGANSPFFSPDGKWTGFGAGGKLKKVAVAGGTPIVLADAPNLLGSAWADDGFIYFVPNFGNGVSRVPEGGGAARPITRIRPSEGELHHRWLDIAPGGKTIVYGVGYGKDWDEAKIVAERLDTGARRVLVDGGTSPRILPRGVLVYERAGSLTAIAFDPRSLTCSGTPVEVAKNVLASEYGFADADFSHTGTLLTSRADAAASDLALSWIDRSGKAAPLHLPRQAYNGLSLAANGKSAAVGIGSSIELLDLTRETLTKVPLSARALSPVLSPDARTLYFALEKGKFQICSKAADGSGPETLVFQSEESEFPLQVSLDGKRMLTLVNLPGEIRLRELGPTATRDKYRTILRSKYLGGASFSPDTRWVTYNSPESGQSEVYARPIDGEERRFQISTNGGEGPTWSHDGSEIFYRRGTQMFAAPVKEEANELRVGTPKLLFENHEIFGWDVDPTGTRFLTAEDPNFGERQNLEVTINWFAEVRRKVREAKTP